MAAPVGALCVRYVKIYFGMLTLAFGMLFYTFLLKFYRLTGGDEGMRVLRPSLLGLDLGAMPKTDYLAGPYYYYSLGILAVAALVMWRIVHSPFGLCLKSVRDNPAKAEALGLGVTRYRWHAFVISAVYAAMGGVLLGPPTGNVDPTLAYWTQSGNIVFMTLLGGFASFFGPILGAFAFIFLQDTVMSVVPYWRLVFGAILAFVVIRAPGGLMGLFARAVRPAQGRERPMILEARDVTVFYGDVLRARGREPRRPRRRVRLDHRPQWRGQVDADQRAHRRRAPDVR